jgi:urease accessory protein
MAPTTVLRRLLPMTLALAPLFPLAAEAHPGHAGSLGMASGALHPLSGPDHLLALLAIGMWFGQAGSRVRIAGPVAFVTLMVLGSLFAASFPPLPDLDHLLAATVVIAGLLLSGRLRIAQTPSFALIAAFGLFHGAAHGVEAPAGSVPGYTAGFAFTSLCLLAAGQAAAMLAARRGKGQLVGRSGDVIVLAGLGIGTLLLAV